MSRGFTLVDRNEEMELHRLETDPFGTNAYIVICRATGESVLIDTPGEAKTIEDKLKNTRVKYILITHGHMDHTMALEELHRSLGATLAAHEADAGKLPVGAELYLRDNDVLECGNINLEVIHSPGHTAGSLCLKTGHYLLSGDTIFPGGPGKTASPDDFRTIVSSVQDKVLTLPEETVILPGHGASTTVGAEKKLFEVFKSREYSDQLCGDVTWLESR
jgi:hydroxyacylglutathione hydrolase